MGLVDRPDTDQHDLLTSYRRKDIAFARALEKALEGYKPPKELTVPQRRLKVFRDESDLTGVEYFESIDRFLQNSAKLIVICSPAARQSDYVNDEIRRFAKAKGADNIISLIVAGVPNNEATPEQAEAMAFSDALCEVSGTPLATSYLGFASGKDKVHRGEYENAWYTLLANIYDVGRSEIEQRDRRQRQRRRNTLTAIVSGVMIMLATLAIVAWWQKLEADKQRIEAERQRNFAVTRQLAAQAELTLRSNTGSALIAGGLLATESLRRGRTLLGYLAWARAMNLLPRKVDDINCDMCAINLDGTRLVELSADGTGRILDATTGNELGQLTYKYPSWAVDFSPDGKRLAIASGEQFEKEGEARVWDGTTGGELARLRHKAVVWDVALSPDGNRVATASRDGTARIWGAATGKELARLVHPYRQDVHIVVFSPTGKRVATVTRADDSVRVWNAVNGRQLTRLRHEKTVVAVAFSPDGNRLVTASWDGMARVWDATTGEELARLAHDDELRAVAFSFDGSHLATASEDMTARVWDPAKGTQLARLDHNGDVNALAFSRDGKSLVTASGDGTARVWDVTTGAELARVVSGQDLRDVTFSPDGTRVVTVGLNSARVWDIAMGAELVWLSHSGSVDALAFDRDGKRLATASGDGTARVWDAATGRELMRLDHEGPVTAVAFSADGTRVIAAKERSARARDLGSGGELARLTHEYPVTAVAFSPDGTRLVTATTHEPEAYEETGARQPRDAWVWDAATGAELARLPHESEVTAVAFSPDGTHLATGSWGDGVVRVWDASTWVNPARLDCENRVYAVAFSPDGTRLASGSGSRFSVDSGPQMYGEAQVWDVTTGAELVRLDHDGPVTAVAFSPDGNWLATGSDDRTARIWDATTGKEVARMHHEGVVRAVAFNPDGRLVATGDDDGTARVWRWRLEDLVSEACRRLTRNLTRVVWEEHLGDEPYRPVCPDLPIPAE